MSDALGGGWVGDTPSVLTGEARSSRLSSDDARQCPSRRSVVRRARAMDVRPRHRTLIPVHVGRRDQLLG